MPNIKNNDTSDKLEDGVTLSVTGASSENEAILAVENYLREHKKEGLELSISDGGEDGTYEIKLEQTAS